MNAICRRKPRKGACRFTDFALRAVIHGTLWLVTHDGHVPETSLLEIRPDDIEVRVRVRRRLIERIDRPDNAVMKSVSRCYLIDHGSPRKSLGEPGGESLYQSHFSSDKATRSITSKQ